MNLTDEKERLYKAAIEADDIMKFESINTEIDSYYIPYHKSKHTESVLEYFDVEVLTDIRKKLEALWNEEESLRPLIPVILAAYQKSRTYGSNYLREMEVYNYMM